MFFGIIMSLMWPIGLIALIVYLVRRKSEGKKMSALDWKRFGVGVAITVVLPSFIGFATSAVFGKLASPSGFTTMMIMAVVFFIIGLILMKNITISASLIIGSIIAIIYAISINIDIISPQIMATIAGLGVIVLIIFAFKKLNDKEAK